MAELSTIAPGSFAWVELSTTDQRAGVAFYRSMFGWDLSEMPMGPGETYSTFRMRGKDVAAAYTMRAEERQMGAPPHWNLYVAVQDADATARRAQELGAKVLAPPFDVMDVGRMAVLQDPTGAVFSVWQPKAHTGLGIVGEPGALCWSELTTRDTKAAEKFYTALFGWTPKHSPAGAHMEYTEFHVDGQPGIGMMATPPQVPANVPSYWMPYFQVADCDAATEKARSLGASVVVGPQPIPDMGRFTVFRDPQGAIFAVFAQK